MNTKSCLTLVLASILIFSFACRKKNVEAVSDPFVRAYETETDWNDPQRTVALNYEQAQGKRIFYKHCVWCHADATPAGPSNRSNVTPSPPLMNDGATLNRESDDDMRSIIALGGTAVGKSAMMPPYGRMLSEDEIRGVIAFARAIAVPAYQPPARSGAQYSVR